MRRNERGGLQPSYPSASSPDRLRPALPIPACSGNIRVVAERNGLNAVINANQSQPQPRHSR
jgi:hypothetical protein